MLWNQKALFVLLPATAFALCFFFALEDWGRMAEAAMTAATVYLGMEATRGIVEQRRSATAEFLRYSLEKLYTPIVNLFYPILKGNEHFTVSVDQVEGVLQNYGYLLREDLFSDWKKIKSKARYQYMGRPFVSKEECGDWPEEVEIEYDRLRKEHQRLAEQLDRSRIGL